MGLRLTCTCISSLTVLVHSMKTFLIKVHESKNFLKIREESGFFIE